MVSWWNGACNKVGKGTPFEPRFRALEFPTSHGCRQRKHRGVRSKRKVKILTKRRHLRIFLADGFCALTTAAQTVILDGINKIKDSPKFCYRKK